MERQDARALFTSGLQKLCEDDACQMVSPVKETEMNQSCFGENCYQALGPGERSYLSCV